MAKPKNVIIEGDLISRMRAATADELIARGFIRPSAEAKRNLSTKYVLTQKGHAYFAWDKPGRFVYDGPEEHFVPVTISKPVSEKSDKSRTTGDRFDDSNDPSHPSFEPYGTYADETDSTFSYRINGVWKTFTRGEPEEVAIRQAWEASR